MFMCACAHGHVRICGYGHPVECVAVILPTLCICIFVSYSCCVLACMIELGMCHPGHYCASVASVPDLTVVRLFAVPILAGTLLLMLLATFSLKFLFLCHMSFGKFGCI